MLPNLNLKNFPSWFCGGLLVGDTLVGWVGVAGRSASRLLGDRASSSKRETDACLAHPTFLARTLSRLSASSSISLFAWAIVRLDLHNVNSVWSSV